MAGAKRDPRTKQEWLLHDIVAAVLIGPTGTGLATEATLALVETNTRSVATGLSSSSGTGSGNIPAGSKAATVVIDGNGGQINGVLRPNGWVQTFEFNNSTLPLIPYNGNGTAMIYVDILT